MEYINFKNVQVKEPTFKNRIDIVNSKTIRIAISKLYQTQRIENFINAHKALTEQPFNSFSGITFDDTDLYKIIEGAGYIFSQIEDLELDKEIDKLIELIKNAQEPSGYITTRHTIHPELKWVCQDAHELYNFGHLIEAAIAHFWGTNKRNFLNVALKAADYLVEYFKDENKWVPGHQEIELALIKLYELSENKNYLNLAHAFLSNRGRNLGVANDYYSIFAGSTLFHNNWDLSYHQDTIPLEYIHQVEGHAVRAMYMYTAMAMLSKHRECNYMSALTNVWDNLITKNMYVTGGIGSSKSNEGFTHDYDLPNNTAYCETCASVGMVYWNSEMFLASKNTKYLDIIDRELKNGIICGLSEDGTKFNYDNPLESDGIFERQEWFECSCCPTQTIRFTPSISKFIFAQEDNKLYINLLISSNYIDEENFLLLDCSNKRISIRTNIQKDIYIFLPSYKILTSINTKYTIENGFIKILDNPEEIVIEYTTSVRFLHANINIDENYNKVAIEYEGFIYCLEEIDCENFNDFTINIDNIYILSKVIIGSTACTSILTYDKNGNFLGRLIPYYLWNNRGVGKMKVWIKNNSKQLYLN